MSGAAQPCVALVGDDEECTKPGVHAFRCRHCELQSYACSAGCVPGAIASVQMHMLLVHPEKCAGLVEMVRRSPTKLAEVRAHARLHPVKFAKLLSHLPAEARTVRA